MVEIEFDPHSRRYRIVINDMASVGLTFPQLLQSLDAPLETVEALADAARRCSVVTVKERQS